MRSLALTVCGHEWDANVDDKLSLNVLDFLIKADEKDESAKRCTKEEQTAAVLLDLTRLYVWLHYYYNIYLIDKKTAQYKAPPHPLSLQLKLTGRGNNTMYQTNYHGIRVGK